MKERIEVRLGTAMAARAVMAWETMVWAAMFRMNYDIYIYEGCLIGGNFLKWKIFVCGWED